MTEIKVTKNGKVVFHSIEQKVMTSDEEHRELNRWAVDTTYAVVEVKRTRK